MDFLFTGCLFGAFVLVKGFLCQRELLSPLLCPDSVSSGQHFRCTYSNVLATSLIALGSFIMTTYSSGYISLMELRSSMHSCSSEIMGYPFSLCVLGKTPWAARLISFFAAWRSAMCFSIATPGCSWVEKMVASPWVTAEGSVGVNFRWIVSHLYLGPCM